MNQNPNIPARYSTTFNSVAALVAGTPLVVVAPASNPNGMDAVAATFFMQVAATNTGCFLAKSSAPTSATDGDPIVTPDGFPGTTVLQGSLKRSTYIAPGKGLYFYPGVASSVNANQISALLNIR